MKKNALTFLPGLLYWRQPSVVLVHTSYFFSIYLNQIKIGIVNINDDDNDNKNNNLFLDYFPFRQYSLTSSTEDKV